MSTAARIDDLRQRFQDNPRRYFASYANELRKLGAHDEAIALCREYLPQVPGHMSGRIVFGQALFEADRLDEARGVFEQALAQDPENLIALRHLGDIDRRSGDSASARRWYERVLEADPRNDDIAAQLATLVQGGVPPVAPVTEPAPHEAESPNPLATALEGGSDFAAMLTKASEATPAWSAPVDPSDPFRFGAVEAAAGATVDPEIADGGIDAADFEEGLVAPTWPDTSALSDRAAGGRRTDTPPVEAAVDAATAAAFGGTPSFDATDDIPAWLRTPPMSSATVGTPFDAPVSPVAAHDEPVPSPMQADGSASAVSFADVHPDVPIAPIAPTPAFPVASVAAPGMATPVAAPAFVTATMGELFVAQGFVDRAIAVYEELLRQRPDDPALARRLTELRQQLAAAPTQQTSVRTVRQRFAALASRRVGDGARAGATISAVAAAAASGVAAATVTAGAIAAGSRSEPAVITLRDEVSLDALFGSGGTEADDRAAQIFAAAYKPVMEAPSDFMASLDRLPSQPPMTSAANPITTLAEPPAPTGASSPFDRYFTDPQPGAAPASAPTPDVTSDVSSDVSSKAADDLAEFSAWLKGLGNP